MKYKIFFWIAISFIAFWILSGILNFYRLFGTLGIGLFILVPIVLSILTKRKQKR